jgi:hypothetical protein
MMQFNGEAMMADGCVHKETQISQVKQKWCRLNYLSCMPGPLWNGLQEHQKIAFLGKAAGAWVAWTSSIQWARAYIFCARRENHHHSSLT